MVMEGIRDMAVGTHAATFGDEAMMRSPKT